MGFSNPMMIPGTPCLSSVQICSGGHRDFVHTVDLKDHVVPDSKRGGSRVE